MENVLKSAGWYPGRKISIHDMKYSLMEAGYSMFPAAEKFMEEYGNIKIELGRSTQENITTFLPRTISMERDWARQIEYLIAGERLVLVGDWYDGDLEWTIFISESGLFYSFYTDEPYMLIKYDSDFRHFIWHTLFYSEAPDEIRQNKNLRQMLFTFLETEEYEAWVCQEEEKKINMEYLGFEY